MRITAKRTPSPIPAAWASADTRMVLRTPSRMRWLNWYFHTWWKSMKWDLSADAISQATTRRTSAAPTQRPQWRKGTALMTSGSVGLTLRPWSAAVERRRLQGPAGEVPLLQDLVVGAVGDDRLQRRLQRVPQLRLFLRDGDAVLARLETGGPHDLEVVR